MQLRGRVVFPNWPAFDNFPFTAVTQLYDTEIERTDQIQIQIPKYMYTNTIMFVYIPGCMLLLHHTLVRLQENNF